MKSICVVVLLATCILADAASRTAKFAPPTISFVRHEKSKLDDTTSKTSKHPLWLELCGQLAPCTNVLCSLAPIPTILDLARTKSVGGLPLLPYSSMVANGFIWALYGYLQDLSTVLYPNICGTILGMFYFRQYSKVSKSPMITKHKLGVIWIVLANAFVVKRFPRALAAEIVGKEGVLVFILLFASPLAAAADVIANKDASSIPLPFTLASTINCSLWSVAGLLAMKDVNIWFPSVMGLLSALAQLFLKGIYGSGVVAESIAAATAVTTQEMSKAV